MTARVTFGCGTVLFQAVDGDIDEEGKFQPFQTTSDAVTYGNELLFEKDDARSGFILKRLAGRSVTSGTHNLSWVLMATDITLADFTDIMSYGGR